MGDRVADNFKALIKMAIDNWKEEVTAPAKRLVELDREIQTLQDLKSPTNDDKKKLDKLKQDYLKCRKAIEDAGRELERELTLIAPPEKTKANADELSKVPEFIKKTIKDKKVSIGKNLTIEPTNVSFDIKALKIKGVTLQVTWRF